MKPKHQTFVFEDYRFDAKTNRAELDYSFDGVVKFTEVVEFGTRNSVEYDPEVLDRALFGLWIMVGVSYFKAYLPPKIVIKKGQLDETQKQFFDSIYTHGLSQFFYTNQLPWQDVVDFPVSKEVISTPSAVLRVNSVEKPQRSLDPPRRKMTNKGSLVAIGGGKDSIVAAELMKATGQEFDTWVVNHAQRFEPLAKTIGQPMHSVKRTIDPKLVTLNEQDAYNGHVPITAILGFVGVALAVLTGKQNVVWAIEASTDEPNTVWNGLEVNHQYSKSSMFEQDMQSYIHNYIAPDIGYFSVLRPLSELRIAEVFCERYLAKYQGLFSSCNANFTLGRSSELTWCGQCPKCAFVFTIFAPFVKKPDLINLFGGKDLFADEALRGTFEQLLGIDGIKPLECVGEVAEVRTAFDMAKATGQYPELAQYEYPKPDYDYHEWHKNSLPTGLESKLRDNLAS